MFKDIFDPKHIKGDLTGGLVAGVEHRRIHTGTSSIFRQATQRVAKHVQAGDGGAAEMGRIRSPMALTPFLGDHFVFVDDGNDALRAVW